MKIITKQSGIISPVIVVAIVVIIIVFLVSFFFVNNQSKKNTKGPTSTPKPVEDCSKTDYGGCDEDQNHFQWKDDGLP